MERLAPDTLLLRRARLSGGGVGGRARLEAGLSGLEPRAIGLPRHAVLIVRRLAAAAPLGQPGFTPAVEAALRTSLARAARPARDGVVGQPDAMLFADEAEMAAWLIGGRVRNDPSEARRWWPSVLRGRPHAAWWRAEVLPRGDLLPRIIDSLARNSEAAAWISELDAGEIDMAFDAIVHAHALDPTLVRSSRSTSPSPQPAKLAGPSPALAMLRRIAPEAAAPALPAPVRRLLAVALAARRDPVWARGPELARAIDALATAPYLEKPVIGELSADVAPPAQATPQRTKRADPKASPRRTRAGRSLLPLKHPSGLAAQHEGQGDASPVRLPYAAPPETIRDPDYPSRSAQPDINTGIRPSDIPPVPLASDAFAARRWSTGFGGLFYLLNALLALELYSDFTQPRGRNLALSPWTLLVTLGVRWFGAAFTSDAAYDQLAKLGGRDLRHRPAGGFDAPDEWRAPRDWLTPWPRPETVEGWAGRRRLVLWHPAGFAIADTRRRPGQTAREQFAKLARRAGLPASTAIRPLRQAPARLGRGATRWLHLLALYLRVRLAQAVAADPIEALDLICRRQATVEASEGVLDIYLSLDDLPLAVRMAGLDRDPGWIPATGLRLAFHFS